jgi:hypothetical protein
MYINIHDYIQINTYLCIQAYRYLGYALNINQLLITSADNINCFYIHIQMFIYMFIHINVYIHSKHIYTGL